MTLPAVMETDVQLLENSIDEMEATLPALQNFVLPGGHTANSTAHVARCVCRRAERLVVHLHELEPLEPVLLRYLNRLSDWLFVFSRKLTQLAGAQEVAWAPRKS
jgi:cob(I)alamin adenosyltransferase